MLRALSTRRANTPRDGVAAPAPLDRRRFVPRFDLCFTPPFGRPDGASAREPGMSLGTIRGNAHGRRSGGHMLEDDLLDRVPRATLGYFVEETNPPKRPRERHVTERIPL